MDLKRLIQRMSLREKLAQMTQLDYTFFCGQEPGDVTGPLHRMGIREEDLASCGSVINITGAELTRRVQTEHLKRDPHQIPLLFMRDVIHGFRTIFPIPLALGCTFSPELARETARLAAREAAASGVHVTFSPMADLVRDARWGRVMEATGEDPFLGARYAAEMVRGYQGADLRDPERIAACVKHIAAYGAAEAGRDYNTVELSMYTLRAFYLPAYKAAVDAGAAMAMSAFHALNGTPCTASGFLLRTVLRKEWGFDGVVISDWGAVHELTAHGVAETGEEAAEQAIRAGVDIEMMTSDYLTFGEELVRSGQLSESLVDEAVLRILTLKDRLGLFEDPFRGSSPERERAVLACPEHRRAARDAAARSLVLLQNKGSLLPLSPSQKVAVIGPYAETKSLLGGWACIGWEEETATLRQGLLEKTKMVQPVFHDAGGLRPDSTSIREAVAAAKDADVILLALGESADMSGEAASRGFIELPEEQMALAEEIRHLGKPVAAVLFTGRPLDLRRLSDGVDALLVAWFPGTEGGAAVADVLYGERMPEGRLSMAFPYAVGQLPLAYNGFSTNRPLEENPDEKYTSRYLDMPNEPLYPFGYGLNYSPVSYRDLQLDRDRMEPDGMLKISVTLANEGERYPVVETVQLYVRDVAGSVVRPRRELVGIQKVHLKPGESRRITLELREEQLRFYHEDGRHVSESGRFEVYVGGDARAALSASFILKAAVLHQES